MVVNRLKKSAHFIPVMSTYTAEDYARIFINEIVCLYGILLSIKSDRGKQFTSRYWSSFQEGLGTKVKLSTNFYPKTDGQAEHTIQTVEDILRDCIIDFKGNWDNHLPLVELPHPYPWLLMKPCMVGVVGLLLDFLKWLSVFFFVPI